MGVRYLRLPAFETNPPAERRCTATPPLLPHTAPTPAARRLRKPKAPALRVHVYQPGQRRHLCEVAPTGTTFGRDDGDADVQLMDPRASREHLVIRRAAGGQWSLLDRGSTNGTYVDGRRVPAAAVSDSSVVRCGDTLLVAELVPNGASLSEDQTVESLRLEKALEQLKTHREPALLLGASGAGKGHFVERLSNAAPGEPLVHVNCAAMTPDLVASELFGHAKSAFTGATKDKEGLIVSADGGTLFLDEIGATPTDFQAKLLTCLESGRIRPVGATRSVPVRVRFVAATNDNLDVAMREGAFRRDLYFRLAAHSVVFRPLVERRADIVPLFLEFAELEDASRLTSEALEALLLHTWPGNIRELRHLARRLGREMGEVDYEALPTKMTRFLFERESDHPDIPGAPTRIDLVRLLADADGNVSAVARQLDEHRTQVRRWIARYEITDSELE